MRIVETIPPRRRGRPKDPLLEEKIVIAAAKVYGRLGWSGFSFDAVARDAGVGKSTLYARWPHAADLLCYVIERRWQALETIDTGNIESDLLAFSQLVLSRYRETGGALAWHLRRDIATFPELETKVGDTVEHTSRMCVDILRRARDRGELREGVSLSLATNLLLSALESYASRRCPGAPLPEEADGAYIARVLQLLRFGIEAG